MQSELSRPDVAGRMAFRRLPALRIVHPFPTLVNAATVAGLGLIATRGAPPGFAIARLTLAMFAIQACIGSVNDLVDRGLDARSKPGKPLVSGAISVRAARAVALVSFAAAALLSAGFGLAAWLLAMAGLACGLTYDLWLKRTPASGLPFLVALPLLPLWVWTALGRFQPELLLLVPLGCLLGLALHLANSLTDFEADERDGAHGLVHLLGKRRSLALCWGSFALVLILVGTSTATFQYRIAILVPGLTAGGLCLAVAGLLYGRRPSRASLQTGWGLLAVGSAALALSWLAALPLH